jgi:hypothetical protein
LYNAKDGAELIQLVRMDLLEDRRKDG